MRTPTGHWRASFPVKTFFKSKMLRNLVRVGRAAAKTVRGARTIDFARALSRSEPAAAPSAEDDVRGAEADRSHSPHSLGAPDGRNPFEVLRVTRSASARDIKVPLPSAISSYPYQVTPFPPATAHLRETRVHRPADRVPGACQAVSSRSFPERVCTRSRPERVSEYTGRSESRSSAQRGEQTMLRRCYFFHTHRKIVGRMMVRCYISHDVSSAPTLMGMHVFFGSWGEGSVNLGSR